MTNKNLTTNEELILKATEYARSLLKIDKDLWVFINEMNHFKGIEHSALYDKDNFLIRYNKEWLKTARKENVIKTAFHEVFHVLQHACIVEADLGMDHGIFTKEELVQMKYEFLDENYSMEKGKYENLLIEVQAESFAYALYEQVKDKL